MVILSRFGVSGDIRGTASGFHSLASGRSCPASQGGRGARARVRTSDQVKLFAVQLLPVASREILF